ncbi:chromosome segregation in meiosis-related protein [Vanrija albida]|uniref:Chromosome segregation in meiosis protein n=1 Tax=Vanrija albida TaxID=181172 RepID=A0ABR3PUZ3_9TREE
MATSLQDLFAFDSPPRPAPKQRDATPLSPGSDAGPSRRTVRHDASNPLFLSPTSNYGTPRKRARDDVWVDSPASARSGPRTPLAPLPTTSAGLAQRAAAAANAEFLADPLAMQDPLAGINAQDEDEPARKRLPVAKVDAERLLAPKGFPALAGFAKKFRPKGKGHEVGGVGGRADDQAKDLRRLMDGYQMWAHGMFPKGDFAHTVQRVETVCATRRMESALKGLRDEFYPKPRDEEGDEPEPDADADADEDKENRAPGAPARAPLFDYGDGDMDDDMEALAAMEEEAAAEAAAAAAPAPSFVERLQGAAAPALAAAFGDVPPALEEEDEWEGLYD